MLRVAWRRRCSRSRRDSGGDGDPGERGPGRKLQSIEFIVGLHGMIWAAARMQGSAIVERLTDPWNRRRAANGGRHGVAVGRYEDARRWASEGFERARGGPDVWRAGLAWRAIARFKLGDWDGALEDDERMEAARAATRFGTTGYFTLTMWRCIALLHELRGERAAADRLVARWRRRSRRHADRPGDSVPRAAVGASRIGRRLRTHRVERVDLGREMGLGLILEAQCDVTAGSPRGVSRPRLATSPWRIYVRSRLGHSSRRWPSTPAPPRRPRCARARRRSRALRMLARAWHGFGVRRTTRARGGRAGLARRRAARRAVKSARRDRLRDGSVQGLRPPPRSGLGEAPEPCGRSRTAPDDGKKRNDSADRERTPAAPG